MQRKLSFNYQAFDKVLASVKRRLVRKEGFGALEEMLLVHHRDLRDVFMTEAKRTARIGVTGRTPTTVKAYRVLADVYTNNPPLTVALTIAISHAMYDAHSDEFVSVTAFHHYLAKNVYRLTKSDYWMWKPTEDRLKRKLLNPKVAQMIVHLLKGQYDPFVLACRKIARFEPLRETVRRKKLADAVNGLGVQRSTARQRDHWKRGGTIGAETPEQRASRLAKAEAGKARARATRERNQQIKREVEAEFHSHPDHDRRTGKDRRSAKPEHAKYS